MRIDPTVALTLMLLSLIVAATSVSASWGYALGRSALKGVTQPDVRPTTSSVAQNSDGEDDTTTLATDTATTDTAITDMVFWQESDIIEEAKRRINQGLAN